MNLKIIFLSLLGTFIPILAFAQSSAISQEYANPSVKNTAPSKGLVFEVDILGSIPVDFMQENGDIPGRIVDNQSLNLKLRFPILLKPGTKLFGGFNYRADEFALEAAEGETFPLLDEFQDKRLQTIGGELSLLASSKQKRFFLFQTKAQLSGDYSVEDQAKGQFVKASVNALIGWKNNPNLSWGLGISYRYTFGLHSYYPILYYVHTLSPKWGIEASLPAKAELRYNLTKTTLLYAGARIKGSNYRLFLPDEDGTNEIKDFGLTEIRYGLRFEQEIYDFIWIGGGGGYRNTLGLDLVGALNPLANNVILTSPGGGFYANVGLYLVVPKKWREKF